MDDPWDWAHRLEELGTAVRNQVVKVARLPICLSEVVGKEGGDTIFELDRRVEPVLSRVIDAWPAECKPLLLIAEGMGADGKRRFGEVDQPLRYRLIVDPIDGTRGLMYDKRSAWFLAAITRDQGEGTTLADTFASAVVELPVSKQGLADSFVAVQGGATQGFRTSLVTGERTPIQVRPSQARTPRNGFGQVSNFFPGTKVLAAELMEYIVESTLGAQGYVEACVYDDQYISTGGQMVELMVGHDRFTCDLRPLFYQVIERRSGRRIRGLECHPYDMAGWLVAAQSGVILTDGFGRPLSPPLDVHTPVHWCAYANDHLRELIEPAIATWLRKHGIVPN